MGLAELLGAGRGVTSVIGSGGKTSLLATLARELPGTVVLTTTTHILPFAGVPLVTSDDAGDVVAALAESRVVCVGSRSEKNGKLAAPRLDMGVLAALADHVLVEADGSRGLPLKAHLPHEPVLPQEAGQVIAVLGLTGLGRPIAEAAHRPKCYAELAGCTPEDIATPERAARVLEAEALHTRVLLNQADAADGTALLARLHCPAVLASLRKGEIVSCSF